MNTYKLAKELDGKRLGRFMIDRDSQYPGLLLKISDVQNTSIFDEELTFTPLELIGFCREVIRITDEMQRNEQ